MIYINSHPYTTYALALLLGGCLQADTNVNEVQAIDISDDYIRNALPQAPLDRLSRNISEQGDNWHIEYHPPEGSTGMLAVDVNKKGGDVVGFSGGQ